LVGLLVLLALAPWVFTILIGPMAWIFLGVNVYPHNMRDPASMFIWLPVFFLWTPSLIHLAESLE
jgi:hypothetical protein